METNATTTKQLGVNNLVALVHIIVMLGVSTSFIEPSVG